MFFNSNKSACLVTSLLALELLGGFPSLADSKGSTSKFNREAFGEGLLLEMTDPSGQPSAEAEKALQDISAQEVRHKALLTGRVEELQATTPKLKTSTGDKSKDSTPPLKSTSPQEQKGKIVSQYPRDFEGSWIGPATIDQHVYNKVLQDKFPKQVADSIAFMYPGRRGIASVTFQSTASGANLKEWPRVTFRLSEKDASFVDGPLTRPGSSMFIGTAPAKNTVLTDGSVKNSDLLFDKLIQYKPGVIEQDFAEVSSTVDKYHQEHTESRENAVYYSMIGDDQMYIYIAQVDYLGNGQFKSKLLMHGILRRKQISG